jgi:hypothetical protein
MESTEKGFPIVAVLLKRKKKILNGFHEHVKTACRQQAQNPGNHRKVYKYCPNGHEGKKHRRQKKKGVKEGGDQHKRETPLSVALYYYSKTG